MIYWLKTLPLFIAIALIVTYVGRCDSRINKVSKQNKEECAPKCAPYFYDYKLEDKCVCDMSRKSVQ